MRKNVVIYARFSSHSQSEQSIEGQLHECHSYAEKNNYYVIHEYIDRAMTGMSDKRPEFQQMIEDSKRKNFEYVLVYQLDRFARNRYDSATYKNKLKKNGVRVLSVRENISEDASGVLMEAVLEGMAEYYSTELAQKVKRGVKESLMKGNFIGGTVLLGYKIVNKKWTIDEKEKIIIEEIFNRYYNNYKVKDIVEFLNNTGYKTKQNKPFSINIVARIIRNSKYAGECVINGVEYNNLIPAIIDKRIFQLCNSKMDEHKHKQIKAEQRTNYILSGKLYCGNCFSLMTAETGTSAKGNVYHYYKCFNKKKHPERCNKSTVSKEWLENFVIENTKQYILNPATIKEIAKSVVTKFNSEITKNTILENYEKQHAQIKKNIDSLINALMDGIKSGSIQEKLTQLEQDRENIEEKILTEKSRALKPLNEASVTKFIMQFANNNLIDENARNDFFNNFINRVILYDNKILIIYNTSKDPQHKIYFQEQNQNKNIDKIVNKDKAKEMCKINKAIAIDESLKKKCFINDIGNVNNSDNKIITKDNKKIPSEQQKFKREALGGEGEI